METKINNLTKLRTLLITTAVIFGFCSAWSLRYFIHSDSISYLDVGDAYLQGDWKTAVNAYWSPLYACLLGFAMLVLKPTIYQEFPLVQLVNFLIYIFAIFGFNFLLNELIKHNQQIAKINLSNNYNTLPEWAWLIIGYTIFVWVSLNLIGVPTGTPDMLVSAFIYLASGILIRIKRGLSSNVNFILLGFLLGFGYLAKTIVFAITAIFLVLILFSVKDKKEAAKKTLITFFAFVLISGPFIFTLSKSKGYFTIGDSGKLNYSWWVNGVIMFNHWQGGTYTDNRSSKFVKAFPFLSKISFAINPSSRNIGEPIHSTRKIFDIPPAYEFATPVKGTYPPWYDPSYWYYGVKPQFDLIKHIKAFELSLLTFKKIFFNFSEGGIIILDLLFFLFVYWRGKDFFKDLNHQRELLITAILMLTGHALISMHGRYIGPFIVLLLLGLYSTIFIKTNEPLKPVKYLCFTFLLVMIAYGKPFIKSIINSKNIYPEYIQVAAELKNMGIESQDKFAYLGNSLYAFWARLAKVQIIAEIPMRGRMMENFWKLDQERISKVIEVFSKTGAKAIVAEKAPFYVINNGWQRIGRTNYYIYFLDRKKEQAEPSS